MHCYKCRQRITASIGKEGRGLATEPKTTEADVYSYGWKEQTGMDKSIYALRLEEGLGIVSTRLGAMQNMICAVNMGLGNEKVEKQAMDVIDCIRLCINDIKNYADNVLETAGDGIEEGGQGIR